MTRELLKQLLEALPADQRQTVGRTILARYNSLNPADQIRSVDQALAL